MGRLPAWGCQGSWAAHTAAHMPTGQAQWPPLFHHQPSRLPGSGQEGRPPLAQAQRRHQVEHRGALGGMACKGTEWRRPGGRGAQCLVTRGVITCGKV